MVKASIHQLTPVQLLIELDNKESDYAYEDLLNELKSRDYTQEALLKFKSQKEHTLNLRQQKAVEPLSTAYKIFLVAIPFTDSKTAFKDVPSAIEEYEAFYESSGYRQKMKDIKKFRRLGYLFWVAFFVVLNLIYQWL